MHDPHILAFEIKYPWWKHRPWPKKYRDPEDRQYTWRRMREKVSPEVLGRLDSFWDTGYRETFISIWHVDPEKDGSDDSCGYSYPRLTRWQRNRLRNAAWHEGKPPHFLCCSEKEWFGSFSDAESLYRGLVLLVARVLNIKLTFDEASRYAAEHTHIRDCIKTGSEFCFVPGYHTNHKEDSEQDRREYFYGILCNVARGLLDLKRPWWKHPKWHFWHWEFQVHPWQTFRRWALSRCCKCGGRFKWGESCCTNSWNPRKPKFLRSEPDIYHDRCGEIGAVQSQKEAA